MEQGEYPTPLCVHIRRYAADNDAFFQDYAAAHKKLSELGAVWQEGTPVSLD
jgi:hypothetical protein